MRIQLVFVELATEVCVCVGGCILYNICAQSTSLSQLYQFSC